QLEMDPALGPRPAQIRPPRSLVGRRGKARVAAPAARATHDQQPLPPHGEIAERLVRVAVPHHGAEWHPHDEILAAGAVAIAALAVYTALGVVVALVAKVEERAERGIGLEKHRAAVAPVAAIGSAAGHVGLAPEAHA